MPRRVRRSAYKFKTDPRVHQHKVFDLAKAMEYFALFMEQGTGKSKVDIDCTAYSYERGFIDAWVIIAPAGVHLNWYRQELPKHLPERLNAQLFCWNSSKASNADYRRALERWLASKHLLILCMNVEAVLTEHGLDVLRQLLRGRACKLTIDESSIIKNIKAQRTKLLIKAGPLAAQRRILTGTPITTGPLNLYSQCLFLDQSILGYGSYYAFAHHYAEWEKKRNWSQGHDYEELICYRNIDELMARVALISFRVTKDECLDLPPKILMPPRYFELTKEQRRLYNQLRDEFVIELEGRRLTAALALTRLLRLQQLICGYIPMEASDPCRPLSKNVKGKKLLKVPGPNRRLETQLAQIEEVDPKKMIIWARFTEDLTQLEAQLTKKYGEKAVVRYDGTVTNQGARDDNKRRFQDLSSPVRFFLGNTQAGGRGHDLFAAEMVSYYSNSFSGEQRIHSEDRVHRDGLKHPVTIGDIVAADTVDEHIIETVQEGLNVARGVMGRLPAWLGEAR